MRQLNIVYKEEQRVKNLQSFITEIYKRVIDTAKAGRDTFFKRNCRLGMDIYDKNFYENNMDEILNRLRELFPDMKVSYIIDKSDRRMIEIDRMIDNHIMIDWS